MPLTPPNSKHIAVLSTGRQDWGILRELCRLLEEAPDFDLLLMLGGMHGSAMFGRTRDMVIAEGFTPCEELSWVTDEPPLHAPTQAGEALRLVAEALQRHRPDALVLAGDRFETASAALAATLERVPIVHLHGGEESLGAMDNLFRHAITKLSHLHFTSHPDHSARVIAMGEDPATVHTVGAPGLDNLHRSDLLERWELERFLDLELRPPLVIVTMHPATLGGDPAVDAAALAAAMDTMDATYVITLPNNDPGSGPLRAALLAAGTKPRRRSVEALGERRFWSLMRCADAMLGNSSSGLIEAPALGLPAVNVGTRQDGRLRGGNVLDVTADATSIAAALRRALSPAFRAEAMRVPAPFGDGHASAQMLDVLRRWTPPAPPVKKPVPITPSHAAA